MLVSLFCLLLLITLSLAAEDLRDYNVEQLIKLAEDISQVRPRDVTPDDVGFYFYTRTANGKVETDCKGGTLDVSKPTKILIHGWLENHKRSWYEEMTSEYLSYGDFNVVQVDWERVARSSYVSSSDNTKLVAEVVSGFILSCNLSMDTTHLIGHSLGAHVAGFAGKTIEKSTGSKIHRITALDAAGPHFREVIITPKDRLDKGDAEIVDAIHTDGGFYGYEKPIGSLDIYFNGGMRPQPGCLENFKLASIGGFIEDTFCSHAKSWRYFIDSINRIKFTCVKCETWEHFMRGGCNDNEKFYIGAEDVSNDTTGVCYVVTTSGIKEKLKTDNLKIVQIFEPESVFRGSDRMSPRTRRLLDPIVSFVMSRRMLK